MYPADFYAIWRSRGIKHLSSQNWNEFCTYGNYGTGAYDKMIMNTRLEEIINFISKGNKPKILDVGCGVGNESLLFSHLGANVLGIDIDKEKLACALERAEVHDNVLSGRQGECMFECVNLLDLGLENHFDAVWMQESLHHLEPRHEIVDKIPRLIKERGLIVISETNAFNPFVQIVLIKKRGLRFVVEFEDQAGNSVAFGNERILTPGHLRRILKEVDLNVLSMRRFRVLPRFIARAIGSKASRFIEKQLYIERVPVFAVHYNMVAQKNN